MFSVKAVVLALFLSFALNGAGSCNDKRVSNAQNSNQSGAANAPVNRQPERAGEAVAKNDLKTLAEGQLSSVGNAFIMVARDAATYGALRGVVKNLPELNEEFFKSNLVVAAFLGERRTGGYGVRFMLAANGAIRVEETRPAKDAMVVLMITYPFSIVAVPVLNKEPLTIDAGNTWRAMTRPYNVIDGEFTMSGGIAGRTEKFEIAGTLGVMLEGELATIFFELRSKGGAKTRILKNVASGIVNGNGNISITGMSAGSFVDPPADLLRTTGQFTENENRLSLTFESIPGTVADGYSGRGTLKAQATAPAPKKNKPLTGDVPQ
jgi:hypothetical protein